jgi:hypothetical protein
MAPMLRGIFRWSIYDKLVSLLGCKIDEDGRAVHENCYFECTFRGS